MKSRENINLVEDTDEHYEIKGEYGIMDFIHRNSWIQYFPLNGESGSLVKLSMRSFRSDAVILTVVPSLNLVIFSLGKCCSCTVE
ncbi:hypothetical protein Y032_0006g2965 [Ancylostoma ceylanicum]|nr:hypothetical protein Y032_0006g2965 [Ancylostoma ceylanicum]